jgi:hypothetical protein
MKNPIFNYLAIDWTTIQKTLYKGETGMANWQTMELTGLRIRIVEYSKDYLADHWCRKGHIVHCLEGEFISELADGSRSVMKEGMTYVVSDDASSHRSSTKNGARLLIIDGDFLALKNPEEKMDQQDP